MNVKHKYLLLFWLLMLAAVAFPMPPHPKWLHESDAQARSELGAFFIDAHQRGVNSQGESIIETMNRIRRDDDEPITLRVAVILVDFDDNEADNDEYPIEHYEDMLFSVEQYETGSMRDYYLENSQGTVNIIGEVAGWYRMPQTYDYYCNGRYGLGGYPRNAQKMAGDALIAADDDLNYADFDNDNDGDAEGIFIVHAGMGAEEDPDNQDLIWSHAWTVRGVGELDNKSFYKYSTVPEDGRIGVYGHELGHSLFGLPDLYDTDYESKGVGDWSMMSYGSWGGEGLSPAHFDAWCKTQLGWANILELEYDTEFTLLPVETTNRIIKMWNPEQRGSQYFLIENRDSIGFDATLPGFGLLVYHVDDAMRNNDNPWWPDNQGYRHNLVAIEQADGEWHLELDENYGDTGDPYPGSSDNHTFDADTEPDSRDYNGDETGVAIREIESGDNGVFARWNVGVDPPEVEQVIELTAGWNLISMNVIPNSCDIQDIFAQLFEADLIVQIKNSNGDFISPAWEFYGIEFWNPNEGLHLNVRDDTELRITGISFDPQYPIRFKEGWQIMPYYPYYSLDVRTALKGLGGQLRIIKDVNGDFYWPQYDYSNMSEMRPGQGYFICVFDDVEMVFPFEE
ncbi:M6 family metalloprotease domain-containing protein [bacterium]|nr:M6 family metalloprotease domain-containing protein [bacterium]